MSINIELGTTRTGLASVDHFRQLDLLDCRSLLPELEWNVVQRNYSCYLHTQVEKFRETEYISLVFIIRGVSVLCFYLIGWVHDLEL